MRVEMDINVLMIINLILNDHQKNERGEGDHFFNDESPSLI